MKEKTFHIHAGIGTPNYILVHEHSLDDAISTILKFLQNGTDVSVAITHG